MAGRQVQNWNEQADRDLLMAIYESYSPNPSQWQDIISRVQAMGYQYTVKAATQHLQKLKRKEPGDGGPKTPAKRGGRAGGASGSKRKAKSSPVIHDDDDDLAEEGLPTPSKKPKRETKVKREARVEADDPLMSLKDEIGDLDEADFI